FDMTRENKLFLYGSIAFAGGSFLIYQSIRRNQIYNLLISKIESDTVSIDNTKIASVLNGLHHTSVGSSKPFVIINEETKREASDKLHNAISGAGTNEDAVYA